MDKENRGQPAPSDSPPTLKAGASLAEAAVLARHANAKVTGAIYAGVSESGKAKIASKLVEAGIGS